MKPLPLLALLLSFCSLTQAASPFPAPSPDTPANRTLQQYWEKRTAQLNEEGSLASFGSAAQWNTGKDESRRQLFEMLGLAPLPPKTPLQPVVTGVLKADGYRVEKLHFQSMPGLYVTANLYLPEGTPKALPTILYVCGHALMKKDGVSFGNKTGYHHHGVWFARHGYACLIIDTLQLGEIEGKHHGTHNLGRWWWMATGYTPAGVEAWNCIRALDYLETRPEVDAKRIGVTGRSGGGAYSWWIAALDERIAAAAPTAGITSLKNHVVDGCIEGHCDCMFMVNTYRWDFDRVAALIAPRPLLLCNTDKDSIFPVDGVFQIYTNVRRLYALLGKEDRIGLHIAEGPHKDLQPLNTGAFHWFERFLKGADPMATTDEAAKKTLEPAQLRVFSALPADERNTKIDESFIPPAPPAPVPESAAQWNQQRDKLLAALKKHSFGAWPANAAQPNLQKVASLQADGVSLTAYDFESQDPFQLRLYVAHSAALQPEQIELTALHTLDQAGWDGFVAAYQPRFSKLFTAAPIKPADSKTFEAEAQMLAANKWAMAYVAPRGVGPLAWTGSDKVQTHRLRRFNLLGETLQSGQVYDIRRAIQAVRSLPAGKTARTWIAAEGEMGVNALYASLFEDGLERLDITNPPLSHRDAAHYLNVLRLLDIPQAAALASERSKLVLYTNAPEKWSHLTRTAEKLGWPKNVQLRTPAAP
jgi:cephalosporin-C deacetylase-like acetyl esterase